MGPECAGANGNHRNRYRSRVRSYGAAFTPTIFTLVGEGQSVEELPTVKEVLSRTDALDQILMQFPTDFIDLVLSPPAAGAIGSHIKNYSKKKKLKGSMPPGRILQEIRRMCIELRLTFWPGMSNRQGQQIACVPYGDEGWRFEDSEKVMSRQELECYLARYGIIRSARS
jgi:hypothetical protein